MAQIARTEADKATDAAKTASDNVAELGKRTTERRPRSCARPPAKPRTRHEAACSPCGRRSMPRPRWSRKPSAAPGKAWPRSTRPDGAPHGADQDNVQLFQTLAQPTNWGQAAQLQNEFLRTSWQRAAQFARRYVEVGQAA